MPIAARLLLSLLAVAGILMAARYIADDVYRADVGCSNDAPGILLRAETLAAIAVQCVGDGEVQSATAYARAALRRQPGHQLALSVLGDVADLAEDGPRARLWFSRAAELGHRDLAAETFWLRTAKEEQDLPAAALHIDALLRAGWSSDAAGWEARELEATPAGRAALVARFDAGSPWAAAFLQDVSDLSDDELEARRATLMLALRSRAPAIGDDGLKIALLAIQALYARGHRASAYALRAAIRPFDAGELVNDPNFARYSAELASPFDWTLGSPPGLQRSLEGGNGEAARLQLSASDPGRYLVAEQTVRLVPGRYSLELSGDAAPDARSSFVIRLIGVESGVLAASLRLPPPRAGAPSSQAFSINGREQFFRLFLSWDVDGGAASPAQLMAVSVSKR